MPQRTWSPGDRIHGFASGVFARDSYICRTVETVGTDWLVTRNDNGHPEFITIVAADRITDPDDRSYCDPRGGGDCATKTPGYCSPFADAFPEPPPRQ